MTKSILVAVLALAVSVSSAYAKEPKKRHGVEAGQEAEIKVTTKVKKGKLRRQKTRVGLHGQKAELVTVYGKDGKMKRARGKIVHQDGTKTRARVNCKKDPAACAAMEQSQAQAREMASER
jgi:hypothetical protein